MSGTSQVTYLEVLTEFKQTGNPAILILLLGRLDQSLSLLE